MSAEEAQENRKKRKKAAPVAVLELQGSAGHGAP
jgi:hypothetical protein